MKTQLNIIKKAMGKIGVTDLALPFGEAVSDLENIPYIEIKYRGRDSKKGTYHPYNIQPNKWGIVGMVYFPVDNDVTDLYITSPIRQEVVVAKKGKKGK